jgi:hypothetical protein
MIKRHPGKSLRAGTGARMYKTHRFHINTARTA